MTLIVHKYGGTSVGSIKHIRNVAKRVAKWHKAGYKMILILSAMSGETNRLIRLTEKISKSPNPRELDLILSTGEQISTGLVTIALQKEGIDAISYTGWQIPIKTNSNFTNAKIININKDLILNSLNKGKVVVITGFQGINSNRSITTLGRGGSDISAIAIAAKFNAKECFIYTDVDGVYTADPNIIHEARKLKNVSIEEMLEISNLGSQVLQIRSAEHAKQYNVKTRILSSLTNPIISIQKEMSSGTSIIMQKDKIKNKKIISSIACSYNEAKITISNIINKPIFIHKILDSIIKANINIDMITQNQNLNNTINFMFTINRKYCNLAMKILKNKIKYFIKNNNFISCNSKVSKISIIGLGIQENINIIIRKIFYELSKKDINIQMISTSQIKISVLIDEQHMPLVLHILHKTFVIDKI